MGFFDPVVLFLTSLTQKKKSDHLKISKKKANSGKKDFLCIREAAHYHKRHLIILSAQGDEISILDYFSKKIGKRINNGSGIKMENCPLCGNNRLANLIASSVAGLEFNSRWCQAFPA